MWAVRAVLITIVIIAIIGFALFNANPKQTVDVDMIWGKYVQVPLLTVVFFSFLGGLIVSLLLFISIYIKQSVQLHSAHKKVNALETEVTVLRNRPIEESAGMIETTDDNSKPKSSFSD